MVVKQIVEKLTIEEKAALLSGRDVWTTQPIKGLGITPIFMADGPHGIRKQKGESDHLGLNESIPSTCFPTSATMANSWDESLGEKVGTAIGKEAKALGVNIVLGPGLNIKRSPLCGRNFEYFSEDPYLAGKMAASYIRGIQSQGVGACPKHFAANNQELRRMCNDSVIDERTLREIYLTNFEIAVREGDPKAIMTSYNLLNGCYTNEDKHLLTDILRDEWEFSGAVITDWGGGNDFVEGIKAGCNLEMPGTGGDSAKQLINALNEGKITQAEVDLRVEELLDVILSVSYDYGGQNLKIPDDMADEHHELACRAAAESAVLLKNDKAILPLDNNKTVAFIGEFAQSPRYQGAGSSIVNATRVDTITELIDSQEINVVGYSRGYSRAKDYDEKLVSEAVELAGKSDIVVCFIGLEENMETEGLDRDHIHLHSKQIKLLNEIYKVNTNIVTVISGGSVISMPWIKNCKAVLHGYLGGQAGAKAILRLLSGQVNPSGKLSETYPFKLEDTPADLYWHKNERTSEYREGIFVGYRYYDTADKKVLFPFGYGLSYTKFSYSNISVIKDSVRFEVTNTGEADGAEVAQLYISKKDSTIFRPKKELKGFKKVFLKAGENRKVEIELNDKSFRYFNSDSDSWEVEPGEYTIMIASDSSTMRLWDTYVVASENMPVKSREKKLSSYYSGEIKDVSDEEFEVLLGRKIPDGNWNKNAPLTLNDALSQMFYAKGWIARVVWRILTRAKNKSLKKASPNLNLLYIYDVAFRGIAKNSGGMVTMEMANQILKIVNGQFFRGLAGLVKAHFSRGK